MVEFLYKLKSYKYILLSLTMNDLDKEEIIRVIRIIIDDIDQYIEDNNLEAYDSDESSI